jgi:uncharacterized repeat protein (TIGR01451 family)
LGISLILLHNIYPPVTSMSYLYAMVHSDSPNDQFSPNYNIETEVYDPLQGTNRIGEKSPIRFFISFTRNSMKKSCHIVYFWFMATACILLWCPLAGAIDVSDVPDAVVKGLDSGVRQEVIIRYDDQNVEIESEDMRRTGALRHDEDVLDFKVRRYRELKDTAETGFSSDEIETVADYSHLPMRFLRIKSRAALDKLLLRSEIAAIFEDRPVFSQLTYSKPFIGQPTAAAAGYTGNGQTVLVIDSGIDYTHSAFGSCTAPGTPAGCRVVAAVDTSGTLNLVTTAGNHGTNVSGIIAEVAAGSKIASFNALPGGSGTSSTVTAGINWGIANKTLYGITTINMSLGDNSYNTAPCSTSNVFLTPINSARAAGILPVAASGNNNYTAGMSAPACIPGVVSVGAVYDANWTNSKGGSSFTWSTAGCTDSVNGPDTIPCFSNSASFLTMLAPGAFITAAGIQKAGTSQASPHVAAAAAILRAAFPSETLDQIVTRMTGSGVTITDSRNQLTFPRLNLAAAVTPPANDQFANRSLISGESGQLSSINATASKETGEPNHAGAAGGKSVWWSWTPSSSGIAAIDTHGSNFDTLLAVYNGTALNSLSLVASNDNDGSSGNTSGVSFIAQAGTTYQIAVDGANGVSGKVVLTWNLAQQADLALGVSGSASPVVAGDSIFYDLAITNNGPSVATGVTVVDSTPAGSVIDFIPAGCTHAAGVITCSFGTLLSGSSLAARIMLHFASPGVYLNTVLVSATTADPLLTNNSAIFSVTGVDPPVAVPGMPLPLAVVAVLALTLITASGTSGKR